MAGNISKYIIEALYRTRGAKKFNKELRKVEGRVNKTGKNTKKAAKAQDQMNKGMKKGASMGAQLTKALKRAAIVAPVWMMLRSVMMGVIATIKEGFQYWMDFDAQLRKSEQVVHGFEGTLGEASDILSEKMKKLSQETGESMTDLTKAFYRFGTVGIDFEKSMEGAETATKLATVMFGNSEKIAKVLAQAYRLLGDTIDKTIPKHERLNVVGAQIYKLWQDNAFEIDELTQALERFLPTANTMNFTLEETTALLASLHTAGVKGSRTGRLLSSSFQRFLSNIDEVANSLGVYVNPQLDSTHDVLERVMKTMHKLTTTGGDLPIEALKKMSDIFGGVRQKRVILALDTMYDTWLDNQDAIDTTGDKWQGLLKDFESGFDRVINSVSRQKKIAGELKNELAMAFVKGVFGGEEFTDTLKNINKWLKDNIEHARLLGKVMGGVGKGFEYIVASVGIPVIGAGLLKYYRMSQEAAEKTLSVHNKIGKAIRGELKEEELDSFIKKLEKIGKTEIQAGTRITQPQWSKEKKEAFKILLDFNAVENRENFERLIDGLKKYAEGEIEFFTPEMDKFSSELTDLIDAMKSRGTELGKILADAMGNQEVRDMAEELEKVSKEEGGIKKTAGSLGVIVNKLKQAQNSSKGQVQEQMRIKKAIETIEPVHQNLLDILKQQTKEQEKQAEFSLSMDIQTKLNKLKKEKELIIEQHQGMTEIEAIHKELTDSISEEVKKYNTMIDTQRLSLQQEQFKLNKKKETVDLSEKELNREKEISKELSHIPKHLDKTKAMSLAINGNYEKLAKLTDYQNIDAKKFIEWQKLSNEELKKKIKLKEQEREEREDLQENIYTSLTRHAEQMLKIQGATTRETLEAKRILEEKLGINQGVESQLNRELSLQQAITKEQLDRNRATSQTVELWKIATQFGDKQANQIKEFLRGERKLADVRGKTRKIMAARFGGRIEEALARKWAGVKDIVRPTPDRPEQVLQETMRNLPRDLSASLKEILKKPPVVQPEFEVMNIIHIDGKELGKAAVKSVETEIKDKNSETNKIIKQSIQDGMDKGEIQ